MGSFWCEFCSIESVVASTVLDAWVDTVCEVKPAAAVGFAVTDDEVKWDDWIFEEDNAGEVEILKETVDTIVAGTVLNAAGWSLSRGQPFLWHGLKSPLASQQPWKDGVCSAQVHQAPPFGQPAFGQYVPLLLGSFGSFPVPIPAAVRSFAGQPIPLHGSLKQHPRKVGDWSWHVHLEVQKT